MTRENKLALIIGFSLILVVAILVADHLSPAEKDQLAVLDNTREPQGAVNPAIQMPTSGLAGTTTDFQHQTEPAGGDAQSARGNALSNNDRNGAPVTIFPGALQTGTLVEGGHPNSSQRDDGDASHAGAPHAVDAGDKDASTDDTVPAPGIRMGAEPSNGGGSTGGGKSGSAVIGSGQGIKGTLHVIREHETLYSIAQHYYGDGNLFNELARFNLSRIADNGTIRAGDTLVIPDKDELLGRSPAPAAPASSATGSGTAKYRSYTIRKDDRLWDIAKEFLGKGSRWPEILKINTDIIKDADVLPVGKTIRIPEK